MKMRYEHLMQTRPTLWYTHMRYVHLAKERSTDMYNFIFNGWSLRLFEAEA